jgi:uncharacterized membrane protein YraQ (UPF0718 family)
MITQLIQIMSDLAMYVLKTVYQDGIYLLISILIAVFLAVFVNAGKARKLFLRKPKLLIPGSVGIGALTPLCACGTMAVVISLLTTALPWGPIMAFLISSPLMSPDTFVLLSGFVGIKFALALTVASVILGLSSGFITHWIEKNSSFLMDQLRLKSEEPQLQAVCCSTTPGQIQPNPDLIAYQDSYSTQGNTEGNACGCSPAPLAAIENHTALTKKASLWKRLKVEEILNKFFDLGIKKILPIFILFVVIAYFLKTYIPSEWIVALFSGRHYYSVPLASVIGLPLYISDATVVPLLKVLKEAGASEGALLAFMISGPATSLGVIGGLNLVMKKRAIILYIIFILAGAILMGYGYDALLWMAGR